MIFPENVRNAKLVTGETNLNRYLLVDAKVLALSNGVEIIGACEFFVTKRSDFVNRSLVKMWRKKLFSDNISLMKKDTLLEFREKIISLFDEQKHIDQEFQLAGDLIKLCEDTLDIFNWEYNRRARAGRPSKSLKKPKSKIAEIRLDVLKSLASSNSVKIDQQALDDFSSITMTVNKPIDRFQRSGEKHRSQHFRINNQKNGLNMVEKRSELSHAKAVS